MNFRAQGAIEYLLIIGAAILVVAIVLLAVSGAILTGNSQTSSSVQVSSRSFEGLGDIVLAKGLVGLWHFNETGGSTFADSSGSKMKGVVHVNAPAIISLGVGKFNNSIDLSGGTINSNPTDGTLIYTTSSSGVPTPVIVSDSSKDLTFSAWINPISSLASTDWNTIFFTGNKNGILGDGGSYQGCAFFAMKYRTNDYKVHFFACEEVIGCADISSSNAITPNVFNNVVGVYSSSQKRIFLYVNGESAVLNGVDAAIVSEAAVCGENLGVNGIPLSDLTVIGAYPDAAWEDIYAGGSWVFGNTFREYFKGKIDEVAIWDRALSAEEVSNLYKRTSEIHSAN
ncbi:MAG: hypothetical protein NTY48_02990 [Candidatus Diapherotrites archaeon]|nr:hypothetical protein [Candidatus Diapherotrites archaeon]